MRLIDADELIVLAENTFSRPSGFIKLIEETETAYNVEAVVAELEELLWDCYTDCGSGFEIYKNRLHEIVRNAGKDGAE